MDTETKKLYRGEIILCERKYGSLSKTPADDPHLAVIKDIMTGNGHPRPKRRDNNDIIIDMDKVTELYRQGFGSYKIARLLKCSRTTVYRHIKKLPDYDPQMRLKGATA